MTNRGLRYCLLLLILLLHVSGAYAQSVSLAPSSSSQPEGETSYLFVSPNTSRNLTLKEALRRLNSRDEVELILTARNFSRCLDVRAVILKTVGNWTDGAEHSILVKVDADEETVRYMDSRLGSHARQKSVLYFQRRPNGAARMYVLYMGSGRLSLTAITGVLDRSGISNRTLLPLRGRTIIYVVDLNNELGKRVAGVALRLGARYRFMSGVGGFIGSSDGNADEARKRYSEVINGYEAQRPQVKNNCRNVE